MSKCCVISEIFDVEKYRDLEIRVRCHSVIDCGTIRKNRYGFLLVFYSNSVPKMYLSICSGNTRLVSMQ